MSSKRSYHQYCGLAAALDVVGERWALLVIRDLQPGARRFTDLFEGLPGISTDMLAERLRQLEAAGAVRRVDIRHPVPAKLYELTPRGHQLADIAASLASWGASLLPAHPGDGTHLRPRWALHSMVLAYRGGLDDGAYEWKIDDEILTVTIEGHRAALAYGPASSTPRLSIRCTTAAFFQLVTTGKHLRVGLDAGTRDDLRRFLRNLPLTVG